MTVKIEDRRVTSSWVPADRILTRVIPLIEKKHLAGIRNIVLLDDDYHTNDEAKKAAARYCGIPRSRAADIELYLGRLNSLPEEVKGSELFLTYHITECLMHEVHHHLAHGQRVLKMPPRAAEERAADRWAQAAIRSVFAHLFVPREKYEAEWNQVWAQLREQGWRGLRPRTAPPHLETAKRAKLSVSSGPAS